MFLVFFDDSKLRKAFVHPKFGQVFMTDKGRIDEENTPTENPLNSFKSYDPVKQKMKIKYFDNF